MGPGLPQLPLLFLKRTRSWLKEGGKTAPQNGGQREETTFKSSPGECPWSFAVEGER